MIPMTKERRRPWSRKRAPGRGMAFRVCRQITEKGKQEMTLNSLRRKAIARRCLDCSGYEYVYRKNCKHADCPLFALRPGGEKQETRARKVAIWVYCRDCCMDGNAGDVLQCSSEKCVLYAFRNTKSSKQHNPLSTVSHETATEDCA